MVRVSSSLSAPGTGAGLALVMGSCLSLQFGAAFALQLFPVVGSWGTTVLRLGFASLIMLAVVRPRFYSWNRSQWLAVLFLGLALGGMNGIFFAALSRIPLGLAVSLEFAGPLALSVLLSRRRIDLLWSVFATVGLILLGYEACVSASNIDPTGVLLALLAGVFWAFYIMANAHLGKLVEGTGGLAVGLAIGSLLLLPLGASGSAVAFTDTRLLLFALAIALFSSALPYSFELIALRRLPRNVFSILLSLEPVFAEAAGLVLLHQETSIFRWIAIIFLITASIGITRSSGPQQIELVSSSPEKFPSSNSQPG